MSGVNKNEKISFFLSYVWFACVCETLYKINSKINLKIYI